MALGLTRNASTANQFCVPCCHGAVGRCCTPELIASNTESLFIHFHNYQQLGQNDFVDIFIDDFTVELKRIDLISSDNSNLGNNYLFSNYQTGSEYISNEGYDQQLNNQFTSSGQTFLFHLSDRLTPVPITIQPKPFYDNTFIVPRRYLPVPGYDKNSIYYADCFIRCDVNNYFVVIGFWRVPVASDPINVNNYQVSGLTILQSTFGANFIGNVSSIDHCGPMAAHGTLANQLPGLYGGQTLTSSPALAYFNEESLIDGVWSHQNTVAVVPACTMDFYISE